MAMSSSSSTTTTCNTSFALLHSPSSNTHSAHLPFHRKFFSSANCLKKTIILRSSRNKLNNIGCRSYQIFCEHEPYIKRESMVPPYNVLITGSTKGIGYALAKEFLKAGDNLIICSKSDEHVESVVHSLRGEFGEQRVLGTKCDVRKAQDVKDLVLFAQKNMKYIDIWINNAGSNAYSFKPLTEASDEDLIEVVTTNTLGLMICCREAILMMMNQPRGGHIFNIDGAGSDGRPTPRFIFFSHGLRSTIYFLLHHFLVIAPATFNLHHIFCG